MKKIFISFLLIITLVCNCSVSAHASSIEDVANDFYLSSATMGNCFRYILGEIGVVLNPSLWGTSSLNDRFQEFLTEQAIIADSDSYMDYLKAHLPVSEDENGEVLYTADNDIVNNLYNFAIQTIEEESGYWVYPTASVMDYITYSLSLFNTSSCLSGTKNYINGCSNSTVFYGFGTYTYTDEESTTKYGVQFYTFDYSIESLISSSMAYGSTTTSSKVTSQKSNIWKYDSDWLANDIYTKVQIDEEGNVTTSEYSITVMNCYPIGQKQHYYKAPGTHYFYYYHWWCDSPTIPDGFTAYPTALGMYTINRDDLRVYMSLDDLKAYSVGQRPYYTTSNFYNYDSTVDNSTTITQTEIDNSVTYGDVYNYIINNYDNSGGLTEDELRAILEEYLSQIGGGSGSGGGSGNDDDDAGGGGLLDFLSGLGSIGDAILSILGKLLEYIGKALELLTGTVTKVLDLIPSNVTNLLLGLFPFIPQEWVTAIELSLVLGVVLAVVGAFKK